MCTEFPTAVSVLELLPLLPAAAGGGSCSYQDVLNYLNLTKSNELFSMTRPVKDYQQPTVVSVELLLYAILDVVRLRTVQTWSQTPYLSNTGLLLIRILTDRDRSDLRSLRLDRPGEFHLHLPFTWNHILLKVRLKSRFDCSVGRISTFDGIQRIFVASRRFRFLLTSCGNQI